MEHEVSHAVHLADTVASVVILMVIAALTNILSKRMHRLPLTVALVMMGVVMALLLSLFPGASEHLRFELTPEMVLFIFLPTLVFETALNLDARQLYRNIWPILMLAVPGLLLSTVIIGVIIWALSDFGLLLCLLLGAILSATDPVAVIALFKQLGVPERLTILVEGESLLNDATSLVLATLLLAIFLQGDFSPQVMGVGLIDFCVVFIGGCLVGWIAAVFIGLLLGKIESEPSIEITFTTILAYLSFIIAEHIFHVSGIMAVVAAGLTIGSWGRAKVSPSTVHFMHQFWEYLAYLANAMIFLLVGFQVDFGMLWSAIDLIAFAVLAMLVSRAVIIFGLMPLIGKLPNAESVSMPFKAVMYWGGLRGAIAMAIVLSMPDFPERDTLIAIVIGCVLFTLFVQGLSIETLVKRLGVDKPSLFEQIMRLDGVLAASSDGMKIVNTLRERNIFPERIAQKLEDKCKRELKQNERAINTLEKNISEQETLNILMIQCLAREKARYYELFSKGLITELSFNELDHTVSIHLDNIKHQSKMPGLETSLSATQQLTNLLIKWLAHIPAMNNMVDRLQKQRVVGDYNVAWARSRAYKSVLKGLAQLPAVERVDEKMVVQVKEFYEKLLKYVESEILEVEEEYPEFVEAVQNQLGEKMLLIAKHESVEHNTDYGLIPQGIASAILKEQSQRIRELNNIDLSASLEMGIEELLKKVPLFNDLSQTEFNIIAAKLIHHTVPRNTVILTEGTAGESMFLLARGVARVYVTENNKQNWRANLHVGDFVGEAALLMGTPRNASVASVTPCILYELHRQDLDLICQQQSTIAAAIKKVHQARQAANTEQS